MNPRTALVVVFLSAACSGTGSAEINGADPDDTGIWTGGDGTTDGSDGTADGSDGTADPAALVGSWSRDEPWDIDGVTLSVVWTGNDDGTCQVELTSTEFVDTFDCAYTAEAGEFSITDDGCEGDLGRYTYTLEGDALSFTLIDDPCEDRSGALASTWNRDD